MYPIICEHCGRLHSLNDYSLKYTHKSKKGKFCRRHYIQLKDFGYFKDDIQYFRPNKSNKYKIVGSNIYFELYDNYGKTKGIGILDFDNISLIENYKWHIQANGYIYNHDLGYLHKIICIGDIVDHINRNKLDNRRENLRSTSNNVNSINKTIQSNNTSGVTGVSFYNDFWHARIQFDSIKLCMIFDNFEDAVRQRLLWEKEFFDNFAPQKHLFEKYNI